MEGSRTIAQQHTAAAGFTLALCTACAHESATPASEFANTPAPPATVTLPVSVDLRPSFQAFGLAPRAQGARPTCSIFTTVAALEFAAARTSGRAERFSVEYANWAANAATGRDDDGDFFHNALAGFERFGIAPEAAAPYAASFDPAARPLPDALVAAGERLAASRGKLRIRWILPWQESRSGFTPEQFDDARRTLAAGWPIAAGSSHSRLLVGYRDDATAPGGGVFLTLDSGAGAFAEVDYEFARTRVNDAFVVEADAPAR